MTSYNGIMIEILGYGVDWKMINSWSTYYYSEKLVEEREKKLFEQLIRIINKSSIIKISSDLRLPKIIPYTGYYKYLIYQDIIKYKENIYFLEKYNIKTYEDFLRKGLSNKKSPIYIDQGNVLIKANEIIKLIHSCGGLAFIAHIFKYAINNHIEFLKQMLNQNLKLDGIEVNHSSFTKEQEKELIKFSSENNLYMSGGSDYHSRSDRKEKMGIGANGEKIPIYINKWYEIIKERCL